MVVVSKTVRCWAAFTQVFPKGDILWELSRMSQLGYWHRYSQYVQHIHHHKAPSFCPFIATPTCLLSILDLWQWLICSPFVWFCLFKNAIYIHCINDTWSHIQVTFWSWIFFTQHNSVKVHPSCWVYQEFFLCIAE